MTDNLSGCLWEIRWPFTLHLDPVILHRSARLQIFDDAVNQSLNFNAVHCSMLTLHLTARLSIRFIRERINPGAAAAATSSPAQNHEACQHLRLPDCAGP